MPAVKLTFLNNELYWIIRDHVREKYKDIVGEASKYTISVDIIGTGAQAIAEVTVTSNEQILTDLKKANQMRKMFRMRYEACSGECYANSDVMRIHNLGLNVQGAAAFLRRLLAMRKSICHHGTDDKLVDFALRFSGLTELEQTAVRIELAR